MVNKPRMPCRHPGCPELVAPGRKYCAEHEAAHRGERPGSGRRGYGSRWQKESKRFLAAHPLCVRCREEGRYVRAEVVDHIKPHRGDPVLFWDEANWQPLCKHHHDSKTMTEDRFQTYRF